MYNFQARQVPCFRGTLVSGRVMTRTVVRYWEPRPGSNKDMAARNAFNWYLSCDLPPSTAYWRGSVCVSLRHPTSREKRALYGRATERSTGEEKPIRSIGLHTNHVPFRLSLLYVRFPCQYSIARDAGTIWVACNRRRRQPTCVRAGTECAA